MTNNQILQADMLDILFEHRNKLYGAYALRKTYDRRLVTALGAALLVALISLSFSIFKNNGKNNGSNNRDEQVVLKTIEIPKDEPKPEPKEDKPKPVATKDYQPIVVVPDKDADTAMVEVKDLENNAIGNKDQLGDKPNDLAKAVDVTEGDDNKGKEEQKEEVAQPDLPTRHPQFPGGDAAWISFLQRYLQAPEDLEAGQKVEVLVRFWVGTDGSVSRAEVVKSGGSSFDKEVLRVLKKMPKWEPALQHGNPVAVAYTQPVTFMGVEQ